MYFIVTGCWPYRDRGCGEFGSVEEKEAYREKVEELFRQRKFPDLREVWGGEVVSGCWRGEYACAGEALQALCLEEGGEYEA